MAQNLCCKVGQISTKFFQFFSEDVKIDGQLNATQSSGKINDYKFIKPG